MNTNKSYTEGLVSMEIDERIRDLRANALSRHIPVMDGQTLQYLLVTLAAVRPKKILEIGTAVGLSAAAMLTACPDARVTTIEIDEERYMEAKKNLSDLGLLSRATCHLGDAGEILGMMDAKYDFVFLDGPKAQYPRYMSELKRMLDKGGVVFADDVLLFGWVSGQTPTPEKHTLFVKKMREYLEDLTKDKDFVTSVIDVGDGVALSVKR
ncbi:MAG: O-methyltransferase [Clostridia bacterium]|nr:O-methyltransferase [Clostridia bacterium]